MSGLVSGLQNRPGRFDSATHLKERNSEKGSFLLFMNPWTANYVFQHKKDKMGIIQMDFAGTNDKYDGYYSNGEALPRIIVEPNRYQ